MLTAEELRQVREGYRPCDDPDCKSPACISRRTIRAALAAYERIAALLERWEAEPALETLSLRRWCRALNELRAALDGPAVPTAGPSVKAKGE